MRAIIAIVIDHGTTTGESNEAEKSLHSIPWDGAKPNSRNPNFPLYCFSLNRIMNAAAPATFFLSHKENIIDQIGHH